MCDNLNTFRPGDKSDNEAATVCSVSNIFKLHPDNLVPKPPRKKNKKQSLGHRDLSGISSSGGVFSQKDLREISKEAKLKLTSLSIFDPFYVVPVLMATTGTKVWKLALN